MSQLTHPSIHITLQRRLFYLRLFVVWQQILWLSLFWSVSFRGAEDSPGMVPTPSSVLWSRSSFSFCLLSIHLFCSTLSFLGGTKLFWCVLKDTSDNYSHELLYVTFNAFIMIILFFHGPLVRKWFEMHKMKYKGNQLYWNTALKICFEMWNSNVFFFIDISENKT